VSRELTELLGRAPLFQALPEEYRTYLVEHTEHRTFGAAETIFKRGDNGERAYIVLEGQVGVYAGDGPSSQRELVRHGPGGACGLASLVSGLPRSTTCRTLESSVLMALDRRLLVGLVKRVPEFSVQLCQELSARVHLVSRQPSTSGGSPRASAVPFVAEVYNLVPRRLLELHRMIPYELGDGQLKVATPDPDNLDALDDLRRFLHGTEVSPVFISEAEYRRFVRRHLKDARLPQRNMMTPVGGRSGSYRTAATTGSHALRVEYFSEQEDKAPAATGDPVGELDHMILEALNLQASDIHVEPGRDSVIIRYRVDGVLQERPQKLARSMLRALVARVKVLAGIDISETRLPQDGRFSFNVGDRLFDMRVATMPTIVGEKVVLRVLDTRRASLPLDELFVLERSCQLVRQLVHKPYGLLVTTGPTGSGKTTTLYASLHERRGGRVNITTVEDPVEYYVPGISQVQVNDVIGLTFPRVLRGILRQNPDIILVGEMRDAETARISLEAGLTGHLVLTSLHANTAAGALLRLLEMDMDPFTIGHAVNGIVNQRLVRQICPSCRAPHVYRRDIVDLLIKAGLFASGFGGSLYRGQGCNDCAGTGLRGRVALFEVLTMTETLRGVLGRGTNIDELTDAAQKGGFSPMQHYARHVLIDGLTTPEEVFRVTGSPESEASGE